LEFDNINIGQYALEFSIANISMFKVSL